MQQTQLYIDNQRVEMFDETNLTITDSIQNVKDISKVFTSYSQSFSVPASKSNNKIFKHYYNKDIEQGFDGRVKAPARLELNYLPFKQGYIKLEGVDLSNNNPNRYRLTFFGGVVALKDLLGDDKLQSLNLSSYNELYNDVSVRNALSADPETNDVIVPLITHTQRLFYDSEPSNHEQGNLRYHASGGGGGHGSAHGVKWSDLKYAIRLDVIVQAISNKYGLGFSNNFFNSGNKHYYNLFMWLHRKKGAVENFSGVNTSAINEWLPTSLGSTSTQMIDDKTMRVTGVPNSYLSYSLTLTSSTIYYYSISLQKDGVEVYNTGIVEGGSVSIEDYHFIMEQGDYVAYIESDSNVTFSNIVWDIEYKVSASDTQTAQYATGSFTYTSLFEFLISQQIPEMKIIDFITGLFKMFNLTTYVDKDTNQLIVKTLDSFYNSGGSYDITKYVDVTKSAVNSAFPYREVSFEHGDTKTFLAANHKELFGQTWGKDSFTGGQKFSGGEYSIKTPFSQLKYERLIDVNTDGNTSIQVGYFVDANQDSYFGKPLLFYPIRQSLATQISFISENGTQVPRSIYNIPSNSLSLSTSVSRLNINFRPENNEYTFGIGFTGTLFEVYYKNYIKSVFDIKNRLTKLTAYLPLRILLNYNLSDRFIVNGSSYIINSIETNLTTGRSELELLNDFKYEAYIG